jgi:hypothetical protein
MQPKYVRPIAILVLAAGAAFGADPKLLNLAMPDTKILAGVNVTTAKVSPLGQFVIAQMQSGVAQMQAAFAALGFDPFTDATELLMASAGGPSKAGGLLMMDGVFKVDQIAAALGGQTQIYAGATLVVLPAKDKSTPAIGFIGSTMAVAGDVTAVKAALDRAGTATTIDPALIARANALSADDDVWIASSAPVASLMGGPAAGGGAAAPMLQMLSSIQSFSGAVKLGGNVQAAAQAVTSSDKNAQALGDVARLIVSMGTMGAAKDSDATGLIQVLQSLQISTSGSNVNLALNLPEAQVEGLLKALIPAGKPNGN